MSIFCFFFYLLIMQLSSTENQAQLETITIRVSTLPSYADCPRRAAAKSFSKIISEAGFSTKKLPNSIGASVGTGVHAGAAYIMIAKRDGANFRQADAEEISIVKLREQTAEGNVWDTVTGNMNTAEKQTRRLTSVFYNELAPIIKPELVENRRNAIVAPGWELSGQSDTETIDETIRDWKTGAESRPYHSQFGGYSLLRRSQGGTKPVRLIMHHLKRVAIDKPQPPVASIEYNVATAERAAWAIIAYIMRDMRNFLKTGDPWSFPCNPMSMMCSEKYCPCYKSTFCELEK